MPKAGDKTTRELSVKLSDEQIQEKGVKLARLIRKRGEVEKDKKDAVRRFNEEISEITGVVNQIAESISTGFSEERVECTWVLNEETKKLELWREDTQEAIQWKDAKPADFQTPLALDDKPATTDDLEGLEPEEGGDDGELGTEAEETEGQGSATGSGA